MTTRMLVDARHREETRVAVIKGNRIEEFDFESAEHKQLKGNIYLAKVTRVEPSLQAAFVEYGGNRHGFLAFSEIHPDYYQIPKEDREALLKEEAEHAAAEAAMRAEYDMDSLEGEIEDIQPPAPLDDDDHHDDDDDHDDGQRDDDQDGDAGDYANGERDDEQDGEQDGAGQQDGESGEAGSNGDRGRQGRGRGRRRGRNNERGGERGADRGPGRDEPVDFRRSLHRRYKIQDVIRRRQVLLVQVVKEERGGKGAALTSYLSLAGRYCVLMPNSSHGGGISRKISNGADRKRLKSVIDDLALPSSMGCIVRTAGLERTKTEIKRDFDYLARLWDEIREKTMVSAAPALIHSDSDLIKRAIRDIYNSGIDEVFVEGDEGYRAAKDFMKLLMPSHAKRVQQYADPVPLFQRYGVEDQLGAMYQPVVTLKSGGYLVINPTEALVSIDINSGRSTREHNIEQTAFSTNIEAAYEIARQLRLRDMAGLVVIDFIDMEVGGNVRKVERAMRDALKNDRARIQVGRISGFGLMEMSRQRLRTGVLEASTRACPHCEGTGLVRTASSAGLSALRLLEEEAARGRGTRLVLRASQEAALYVLNNKRAELSEIETRYGVMIEVQSDGQTEGARMSVDVSGPPPANLPRFVPIVEADEDDAQDFIDDMDDEDEEEGGRAPAARNGDDNGEGGERARRKRSRRRRGRRDSEGRDSEGRDGESRDGEGRDDNQDAPRAERDAGSDEDGDGDQSAGEERAEAGEERGAADENGRRRRRGRRGGRGRRNNAEGAGEGNGEGSSEGNGRDQAEGSEGEPAGDAVAEPVSADAIDAEAPKPKRRRGKAAAAEETAIVEQAEPVAVEAEVAEAPKPKRRRTKAVIAAEEAEAAAQAEAPVAEAAVSEAAPEAATEAPAKPKRASRARKPAADTAPAAEEAAPAPVAPRAAADMDDSAAGTASDGAAPNEEEGGERRRGWWQRTFGA